MYLKLCLRQVMVTSLKKCPSYAHKQTLSGDIQKLSAYIWTDGNDDVDTYVHFLIGSQCRSW